MKNTLVLLCFLLSLTYARADFGTCYCFEVEVITADKVFRGFIRLDTYTNINNDSLSNSTYFTHKVIKSNNSVHHLVLHKFSIPIKWKDNQTLTYFSKSIDSIKTTSIEKIKWLSSCYCSAGTVINSNLNLEDQSWATKIPLRIESFVFDICDIDALIYEDSEDVRELIAKLKASPEVLYDLDKLEDLIKIFHDKKIIIVQSCSC